MERSGTFGHCANVGRNKGDFMNYSLAQENISASEYQQLFLGNWAINRCMVNVERGKDRCPDKAEHFFEYNGEKVAMCKRCFIAFSNGAYSAKRYVGDRLYIGQQPLYVRKANNRGGYCI